MADEQLSERARAILDAAERAATGRAPSPAAASSTATREASVPAVPPHGAPPAAGSPDPVQALADQAARAAEAARRSLDALAACLDALTREIDATERAPSPAAAAPPHDPIPWPEPPHDPRPRSEPPHDPTPPHDATPWPEPPRDGTLGHAQRARRAAGATAPELAAELAAGGATRMAVDARLRADFGLRNTRELLDALYGAGSAPDAIAP